jgi:hypothetical protein
MERWLVWLVKVIGVMSVVLAEEQVVVRHFDGRGASSRGIA